MKKRNRWMLMAFQLLTGKLFSGPKMNIGQMTSDAMKKAALGIAGGFIVMTFFFAGMVMTLVDLFVSYRESQQLTLTPFSWISGIMMLLPLIALGVWSIDVLGSARRHRGERPRRSREDAPPIDGLTAAVTALIQDFIVERKFRRDQEVAASYAAANQNANSSVYSEIFEDNVPNPNFKQAV